MLSKRHAAILKLLETGGTVSVADLALELGVSLETVRRDLGPLAAAGTVIRVHGAVGLAGQLGEAPFQKRMRENAAAKQAIALTAAAMVRDGDSLMLDTGSTTSFVARALARHQRLTVITNSTDIARLLLGRNGNRVFLAGGALRPDSGAAFGKSALDFIAGFRASLAILSAGALDSGGPMDHDLDEAELARLMLARADRALLVSDASKFDRAGLVRIADFAAFAVLVTDRPPPPGIAAALTAAGTVLSLPLLRCENTPAGGT